jgi:hypothetical protein
MGASSKPKPSAGPPVIIFMGIVRSLYASKNGREIRVKTGAPINPAIWVY